MEAIWNSIASETKAAKKLELRDEHKNILDEELVGYIKNPKVGSSWETVKGRNKKEKMNFRLIVRPRALIITISYIYVYLFINLT